MNVEPASQAQSLRRVQSIHAHRHDGAPLPRNRGGRPGGNRLFGGRGKGCLDGLIRLFCAHIQATGVSPLLNLLVYIPHNQDVISA
jgi:hypothetical protein